MPLEVKTIVSIVAALIWLVTKAGSSIKTEMSKNADNKKKQDLKPIQQRYLEQTIKGKKTNQTINSNYSKQENKSSPAKSTNKVVVKPLVNNLIQKKSSQTSRPEFDNSYNILSPTNESKLTNNVSTLQPDNPNLIEEFKSSNFNLKHAILLEAILTPRWKS